MMWFRLCSGISLLPHGKDELCPHFYRQIRRTNKRSVGKIAPGARQHSQSRFRVPSGPMTTFLFFPELYVFFYRRGGDWVLLLTPLYWGGDAISSFKHRDQEFPYRYAISIYHSNELSRGVSTLRERMLCSGSAASSFLLQCIVSILRVLVIFSCVCGRSNMSCKWDSSRSTFVRIIRWR
jgi:hypothetical protein